MNASHIAVQAAAIVKLVEENPALAEFTAMDRAAVLRAAAETIEQSDNARNVIEMRAHFRNWQRRKF